MEYNFLDDLSKSGRSIITIGSPESGKTYLALKYLIYALNNKHYDEFHLVLPQFSYEQNDSYAFLKSYKDNVFVYDMYDDIVVKRINLLKKKKRIFFLVDDLTGNIDFYKDKELVKLISTTRHGKGGCTVWLICHASKKVLSKSIRNCVKYIFISSIESDNILRTDIYEDFASIYYKKQKKGYDQFFDDYMAIMDNNEFGIILLARRIKNDKIDGRGLDIDFEVNKWNLYNVKPIAKPVAKPALTEKTNNSKYRFSRFSRF